MAEQSLDIVIRARNEASKELGTIGKQFEQMKSQALGLATGVLSVQTATKGLAAATMLFSAQRQAAADLERGDIQAALTAQLDVNRAWGEFGRAVPVVGESVGKIVDALNRASNESIKRLIEGMKQVDRAAASSAKTVEDMVAEADKLRLSAFGSSERQERGAVEQRQQQRQIKVDELWDQAAEARRVEAEASRAADLSKGTPRFDVDLEAFKNARAKRQMIEKNYERTRAAADAALDADMSILAERRANRQAEYEIAKDKALTDYREREEAVGDELLRMNGTRLQIELRENERKFERLRELARENAQQLAELDRAESAERVRIQVEDMERVEAERKALAEELAREEAAAAAEKERALQAEHQAEMARQREAARAAAQARAEAAQTIAEARAQLAETFGAQGAGFSIKAESSRRLTRSEGYATPEWANRLAKATEETNRILAEKLAAIANNTGAAEPANWNN